ncbi:hypothetical protein CPB86DRAFT_736645 [Serendipita vermifera]|nr:hypothetical protein CPB86DRAFT_736645 [Serendipita vermifera]
MEHLEKDARNHRPFNLFPTRGVRRPIPTSPSGNVVSPEWQLYNDRAAVVDHELMRDWTESLSTLLIIAALYSAVLTGFIVESIKLLQEDPQEVTRQILVIMSSQLANTSNPAYTTTPFHPPSFVVRVNGFLFFSLSCSLMAALGAVLALQWVGNYDAGLNISSLEDRAAQRHFRYLGVEKWKMAEIIAALPLLLFVGLALLFLALADWLLHVHRGVAAVIITWLGSGVLFFTITTTIGMMYPSAPFRRPISKSMPLIFGGMLASSRASARFLKGLDYRNIVKTLVRQKNNEGMTEEGSGPTTVFLVLAGIFGRLSLLVQAKPFSERESEDIWTHPGLTVSSLLWAVRSTEVSQHSRVHFLEFLKAFLSLPHGHLFSKEVDDPSWVQIFTFLCKPYQSKKFRTDYTIEDLEEVSTIIEAMSVIGNWIGGQAVQGFIKSLAQGPEDIISLSAQQARWKHTARNSDDWEALFLLPIDSFRNAVDTLSSKLVLRIIHAVAQEQRTVPRALFNQALTRIAGIYSQRIQMLHSGGVVNPLNLLRANPVSQQMFGILARSMTASILGRYISRGDPLQDYIYAVERRSTHPAFPTQLWDDWNTAVYHYLLSHLVSKEWTKGNEYIVDDVILLVRSGVWTTSKFNMLNGIIPLLRAINGIPESYMDSYKDGMDGKLRCYEKGILLVSLALPTRFDFHPWERRPEQLSEWIVHNLLGFDAVLMQASGDHMLGHRRLILHHIVKVSIIIWKQTGQILGQEQIKKLTTLGSGTMRLIGSLIGDHSILPENIDVDETKDELFRDIAYFWCKNWGKRALYSRNSIIRTLIQLQVSHLTLAALELLENMDHATWAQLLEQMPPSQRFHWRF